MANSRLTWRRAIVITAKSWLIFFALIAMLLAVVLTLLSRKNATQYRSLANRWPEGSPPLIINVLKPLPELNAKSTDGIRFAVMPTFGRRYFMGGIYPDRSGANGTAAAWDRKDQAANIIHFRMTAGAYRRLGVKLDRISLGYTGEFGQWSDGTAVAIERKDGLRLYSAYGNNPCHYDLIANALAQELRVHIPDIQEIYDPGAERMSQNKNCSFFPD